MFADRITLVLSKDRSLKCTFIVLDLCVAAIVCQLGAEACELTQIGRRSFKVARLASFLLFHIYFLYLTVFSLYCSVYVLILDF